MDLGQEPVICRSHRGLFPCGFQPLMFPRLMERISARTLVLSQRAAESSSGETSGRISLQESGDIPDGFQSGQVEVEALP